MSHGVHFLFIAVALFVRATGGVTSDPSQFQGYDSLPGSCEQSALGETLLNDLGCQDYTCGCELFHESIPDISSIASNGCHLSQYPSRNIRLECLLRPAGCNSHSDESLLLYVLF